MREAFFFGCYRTPGHYLYLPGMRRTSYRREGDVLPAALHPDRGLDGGYAPKGPEVQGAALLHHVEGWTVLAFWDRSGDERGKSNSAFLLRGTLAFDTVVERSRELFPQVWQRFPFDVVNATPGASAARTAS